MTKNEANKEAARMGGDYAAVKIGRQFYVSKDGGKTEREQLAAYYASKKAAPVVEAPKPVEAPEPKKVEVKAEKIKVKKSKK